MTREEKLIAMNGQTLIKVADKLGVKVTCNRTRTALKESKMNVVKRILAAEDNDTCADGRKYSDIGKEIADQAKQKVKEVKKESSKSAEKKAEKAETCPEATQKLSEKPKHGGLIEYNGKSQTISKWSKELNKPIQTLYGRLYILGWPVEKAFTK